MERKPSVERRRGKGRKIGRTISQIQGKNRELTTATKVIYRLLEPFPQILIILSTGLAEKINR